MIELNATFATIVALIVGVVGPYLAYRTHQQDKKLDAQTEKLDTQTETLDDIHHQVNSRLTEALNEIKNLRELVTTSRSSGEAVPKKVVK